MKKLILILVLLCFVSIYWNIRQQRLIIEQVQELDKSISLQEAMEIYKQGYEKGGQRFAGNPFNYAVYFDYEAFKVDSILMERTIKKAIE